MKPFQFYECSYPNIPCANHYCSNRFSNKKFFLGHPDTAIAAQMVYCEKCVESVVEHLRIREEDNQLRNLEAVHQETQKRIKELEAQLKEPPKEIVKEEANPKPSKQKPSKQEKGDYFLHTCTECGEQFISKNLLNVHMRKHG